MTYASNVLGSRGPRKMKVALPRLRADGSRAAFGGGVAGSPPPLAPAAAAALTGGARQPPSPAADSSGSSGAPTTPGGGSSSGGGGGGSMLEAFRNGYTQDMVLLINKPPKWNDSVGAYVLNFGGRVTQASVKNFQLVAADDHESVLLQFGRCDKDAFSMDFAWPLCAAQAFAICLSSFDFKLACE